VSTVYLKRKKFTLLFAVCSLHSIQKIDFAQHHYFKQQARDKMLSHHDQNCLYKNKYQTSSQPITYSEHLKFYKILTVIPRKTVLGNNVQTSAIRELLTFKVPDFNRGGARGLFIYLF